MTEITDEMKRVGLNAVMDVGYDASRATLVRVALAAVYPLIEKQVREECARVAYNFTGADHAAHDIRTGVFPKQSYMGEAIAAAIRALGEKP